MRFEGAGHTTGKREIHVAFEGRTVDFDMANLVVLQHIDDVDPWLEENKKMIADTARKPITLADILRPHNSSFLH